MTDAADSARPAEDRRDRRASEGASIEGDRGIAPISGRLSGGMAGKAMLFAGLVAGSAVLLLLSWEREAAPAAKHLEPARQIVPFEPSAELAAAPTLAAPGPNPPTLSDVEPEVPALDPSASAGPPPPHANANPPASRSPAPLLVYSRGLAAQAPSSAPSQGPTSAPGSGPTELEALTQGSRISRLQATRLADRNFLILAGANLPCTLQTALDSTTPGFAACVTPSDVYSDNGGVVLLEKGTRVLGEYRSGLRQGQRRIFVLWTRAVTPTGVAISLGSPAADGLGRAGFDGEVDTHFWDRFGAGLMLSLVDEGAYAARGGDSGAVRIPSDAAAIAVEGARAIGPTLRKSPGAEVSIFVAHDLDFSNVYGLAARP